VIQMQTMLNSADNSGARRLMCIKVLGGSKRRYANIGDIIKVSIKEAITLRITPRLPLSFPERITTSSPLRILFIIVSINFG